MPAHNQSANKSISIYTPEQRRRRDTSPWTLVQGVLAPLQFVVFVISLALVIRFLLTGQGLVAADWSVVVKTFVLYAIMVTGSIWEKAVFGQYLFAKAFFWEDVFSILVLALHTAYLAASFSGALSPVGLMGLALAAYAAYLVNAGQFLWKLRLARLDGQGARPQPPAGALRPGGVAPVGGAR
ncbi:MAG: 2-vinyl bacteriochlorophyllide hydratase [Pseudomonadota bacterium]